MAGMFDESVDVFTKEVVNYLSNLEKAHLSGHEAIKELETEVVAWRKEKKEWEDQAVVINEFLVYDVDRFLVENIVSDVNENVPFIVKANLDWQNEVIEEGIEEFIEFLKEVMCIHEIMDNSLKVINVKMMENTPTTNPMEVKQITSLREKMKDHKHAKDIVVKDFTRIGRVDSLVIMGKDHLETHKNKLEEVQRRKDIWTQRVKIIGVPNQRVLMNFMEAFKEWSAMRPAKTTLESATGSTAPTVN